MAENKDKKVLNVPNKRELTPNTFDSVERKEVRLKRNVPNLRFKEFEGEWKECRLGDLTTEIGDGIHTTPNYEDNGNYYFINGNNISEAGIIITPTTKRVTKEEAYKNKAAILHSNTILLSINGTIGNVALYNNEPIMLGKSACYINLSSKTNRHYVFHYLQIPKCQSYFTLELTGTTIKNLSLQSIRKTRIALPILKEQNKIATFLSLLDERIATQNKIIEELKKLKNGIINNTFNFFKTKYIPFKNLYEDAGEGGTPSTSNASYYDNGTIPFIKIDDLKKKYLTCNKDYITNLGLQKSSAWLIPTNSILFSNGATIGEISITTYSVATKQGILGIVPNSDVDTEYLYYLMSSQFFKKAINRIITEGTMKTAYLKDINKILCPFPNKEVQQNIAKLPSILNRKIEIEQSLLDKFLVQKQYLLRQMFI